MKRKPPSIRAGATEDPAAIFAFDLLWLDGEDYRERQLIDRKTALYGALPYRGR